ncbi:DUF362 domain-containing protein [Candidatus Hecatella orcuttiae]|uniref:DUF362 domain-containing protein n=1 Tax=Candidatus Hecatella orcuttiae TaxID=1935119 RepID=UPI002868199A|nr:DUF362 domain-containing protein [Candidatus Hecatella orcuttiae]
MKLTRRKLVAVTALGGIGVLLSGYFLAISTRKMMEVESGGENVEVYLIKTSDRSVGIRSILRRFGLESYRGKTVALKANFNSADPFPASTHVETLRSLVEELKKAGVGSLTLAERSGMGDTRKVLEQMGVFNLSEKLGFKTVVLDEEGRDGWVKIQPKGTHWLKGFPIARVFLDADRVVQTCCLKTHRFGGHFTMSLKNSVGLVAKHFPGEPYNYMWELHSSPYQRLMIAEINRFYKVDLVLMDALEAFVSGGPERGELVKPSLLLASRDRVAIDAVGVAILRSHGSTKEVMKGRIFDLDQIRRAAELGLGVSSPSKIKLIPLDGESVGEVKKLEEILRSQG